MKTYFNSQPTQTLYKLVGGLEHHLVSCYEHQAFPLASDSIILYAALGDEDAIRIAEGSDEDTDTIRYLLKTKISKSFIDNYPETISGQNGITRREFRFWPPSWAAMNKHIVGRISVIHMFPAKNIRCLLCGWKTYDERKNVFWPFCDQNCQSSYELEGKIKSNA